MDDTRRRQFFLEPTETYHRQYEALRTFFVEGRQLREIAQQFGYQESALRVKVNDLHLFLFGRGSGGRRGSPVSKRPYVRKRQRSLTAAP